MIPLGHPGGGYLALDRQFPKIDLMHLAPARNIK
jgi:hypothetical protein